MSRLEEWNRFVGQVRERTSLREIVSTDTSIDGGGFGLCPFHNEKSPSFHLYDSDTKYKCFGCGVSGDLFSYIQARDDLSFPDAVKALGKAAGTPWDQGDSVFSDPEFKEEMEQLMEQRRLHGLLTHAGIYMTNAMPSRIAKLVTKNYGFSVEDQKKQMIGWASDSGHLEDYLVGICGYSKQDLVASGLFLKFKRGLECLFQNRIMFCYQKGGRVVYMIGRRVEGVTDDAAHEKGKYKKLLVHSDKHSQVSEKISNEWFYGEDTIRGSAAYAVITEGVTDCAALHIIKVHSISPVTVRFRKSDTPRMIEVLKKVPTVYICNDNDIAADGSKPGLEGAIETAKELYQAGIDARIMELPRPDGVSKVDVCDFVRDELEAAETAGRSDGKRLARLAFERLLDTSLSYPQFLIEQIPKTLDPTALTDKLKPIYSAIASCSATERDGYATRIARRFGISKAAVRTEIADRVDNVEQRGEESEPAWVAKEGSVRGEVFEEVDHYYLKGKNGDERISTFTVRPHRLIKFADGRTPQVSATLRTANADIPHVFGTRAWTSKRDFIRDLPHPSLQWTGGDDNVMGVLELLQTHSLPTNVGTNTIGLHETDDGPIWVTPNQSFSDKGVLEESPLTYIENGSALAPRVRYEFAERAELRALGNDVLPNLLRLNKADVMLPTIGWFFSTLLKPMWMRLLGHFPILMVHGTQGCGKTSLIRDVFLPLFGIGNGRDPFSCTDTPFAITRNLSSSSSVPILLDEFKPRDMGRDKVNHLHRTLRGAYNCETVTRGRADQGVNLYRLQAPTVVCGETRPEGDPALMERMIVVNPDKTELTDDRQKVFQWVTTRNLPQLAGPLAQFAMGLTPEELLAEGKSYTDELLARNKRSVPIRCHDNLSLMVTGLVIYQQFAAEIAVELPDVDYVVAFESVVHQILEGDGDNVKNALDHALEALSVYAHLGALKYGKHYTFQDGKLCLHLRACHEVYLQERRKTGRDDDTGGVRALLRIANESRKQGGYVEEVGHRVEFSDGISPRCIVINVEKIPEHLDVNEFPLTKKHWAGTTEFTRDPENTWNNN